jgi:hypothetical protein
MDGLGMTMQTRFRWLAAITGTLAGCVGGEPGDLASTETLLGDVRLAAAIDVVDPNPALLDPFTGEVIRPLDNSSVALGSPAHGAAADGVTELLLRSRVPGPGIATFALTSAQPTDGSLAVDAPSPTWKVSVATDAVQIGQVWYIFALYRSPAAFRPGGDAGATLRPIEVSVDWTPVSGDAFHEAISLDLVRPPVVIIPELYSSCRSWTEGHGLLSPGLVTPFSVACADYLHAGSLGPSSPSNLETLRQTIADAVAGLRASNLAATQVDVVGDGVGGLLARAYIDSLAFLRFDNFAAGDVRRLITMDTPHLGARLATEVVRMREFLRSIGDWQRVEDDIAPVGVFIDDLEGQLVFDDLVPGSLFLRTLGAAPVQSHALIGIGGHAIPRSRAFKIPPARPLTLYHAMEQNHPATKNLSDPDERLTLIAGAQSVIFCPSSQATPADDHDLFTTTWEQAGGLSDAFTTRFTVSETTGEHFTFHRDRAHTARLIELLDAPEGSGLFADGFPAPRNVGNINSCPLGPL